MLPFSEWIKLPNGNIQFNFRKIQAPNQEKFFITGEDFDKKPFAFDMIRDEDKKWSIVQPAPVFTIDLKDQLINVIKRHV